MMSDAMLVTNYYFITMDLFHVVIFQYATIDKNSNMVLMILL